MSIASINSAQNISEPLPDKLKVFAANPYSMSAFFINELAKTKLLQGRELIWNDKFRDQLTPHQMTESVMWGINSGDPSFIAPFVALKVCNAKASSEIDVITLHRGFFDDSWTTGVNFGPQISELSNLKVQDPNVFKELINGKVVEYSTSSDSIGVKLA